MKRLKTWHLVALTIALPILFYGLPSLGISLGSVLIFLLALACPLFHLLGMHGAHGHGAHGGHGGDAQAGSEPSKVPAPQAEIGKSDGSPGR